MFKQGDKVRAKYTGNMPHGPVTFSGNAVVATFDPTYWVPDAKYWIDRGMVPLIFTAYGTQGVLCWPSNIIMGWADPPVVKSSMLTKVLDAYKADPIIRRRDKLLADLFGAKRD